MFEGLPFYVWALVGLVLALAVVAVFLIAKSGSKRRGISDRSIRLDRILAKAMPRIRAHWRVGRVARLFFRDDGPNPVTRKATDAVDGEILAYFERLKALPDPATDEQILMEMKRLYEALDRINAATDYCLLETDERELLVTIFIAAAEACGIDSREYDGEPGGEYRDF